MTRLLPNPVRRPPTPAESVAQVDVAALERDLAAAVDGEVRFDAGSRAAYSTDASNFRQIPIGVVVPRTVEAAVAAVAVCRRHRAPIVSRGGGTSLAGRVHQHGGGDRLVEVLPPPDLGRPRRAHLRRRARHRARPDLNDQLAPHELEFGPEPATHDHCTLGGMIGNNSCGATAQRTGKVVDNVAALEVLLYDGTRMWVGRDRRRRVQRRSSARGGRRAEIYRAAARAARRARSTDPAHRYPHIPRRVSGYNLDSLLPEKGFRRRAGAGRQRGHAGHGAAGRAEARAAGAGAHRWSSSATPTSPPPPTRCRRSSAHEPIALEGLDAQAHHLPAAQAPQPGRADRAAGGAGLPDGADRAATPGTRPTARPTRCSTRPGREPSTTPDVAFFDDPEREKRAVAGPRVRARRHRTRAGPARHLGGLGGLRGRRRPTSATTCATCSSSTTSSATRDRPRSTGTSARAACTPASRSTCYTRRRRRRLPPLHRTRRRPRRLLRRLAVRRARRRPEPRRAAAEMFGDEIVAAFGRFKAIFDPDDRMNPGKVVAPYPLDAHLRLGVDCAPRRRGRPHFRYPEDDGSFGRAVLRCVGVGKCRRARAAAVMCPSYQVTREEEHSTRGRARLLFEMLDGARRDGPITDGWRSHGRSATPSTCAWPARAARPTARSTSTWPPTRPSSSPTTTRSGCARARTTRWAGCRSWSALAGRTRPRLVNALLARAGPRAGSRQRPAGIDEHRDVPRVRAADASSDWFAAPRRAGGTGERGDGRCCGPTRSPTTSTPRSGRRPSRCWRTPAGAVIVPDRAGVLRADLDLHRAARHRQAGAAPHASDVLRPHLRAGDPRRSASSRAARRCSAADATELFPDDADVERLRRADRHARRAARATTRPGWEPPRLDAHACIVQTHCHHHAIMGYAADRQLLDRPRRRGRRARLRLLRPGRQLRLRDGPLRGLRGLRRARAAARGARRRRRRRDPRRRLQLPHADRAGRHPAAAAPSTSPSCCAPHCTATTA